MDTQPFIGDLIISLYKELKTQVERDLKPLGIGMGQLQILMLFYDRPECRLTQQEISNQLDVDKGNISRSIAKLVGKGWIEADPQQPRKFRLTGPGNLLRAQVLACLSRLEGRMTDTLGANALKAANQTLRKMLSNLEDENGH